MRVAEIYESIQGEGLLTGTKSIFVRASGCNLRCWFCDTHFTSWAPTGEDLSVKQILAQVERFSASHAVITGGEPMLFAELIPLCNALRDAGLHITIETAGTLHLPLECDLMSISPKLANSTPSEELAASWRVRHEQTRHAPAVVARLTDEYAYQLKFVVDQPSDCDEVEEYLALLPSVDRQRVMLMPQGTDREALEKAAEWLAPVCQQRGLQFCPRKQIEMFGLTRGT